MFLLRSLFDTKSTYMLAQVLCIGAFFCKSISLFAQPENPVIVRGQATFFASAQDLQIETKGQKTIINWDRFSLQPQERVRFLQPNEQAAVLNRVVGETKSLIEGSLTSNGKVFLLNPRGILVSQTAVIDVHGLIASTLALHDDDFYEERLCFRGTSPHSVENRGTIYAREEDLCLMGIRVTNEGVLQAPRGEVRLLAGTRILLAADRHIYVDMGEAREEKATCIDQAGTIEGNRVTLQSQGPYASIQQRGKIQAVAFQEEGGRVFLVAEKGKITLSKGTVSARYLGEKGGDVRLSGEELFLKRGAKIDVAGDMGAGNASLGEAWAKTEEEMLPAAKRVSIEVGAEILGNAGLEGRGAFVTVFGSEYAAVAGKIAARGGRKGGDGGRVEISAMPFLTGFVDTRAPCGETGLLIFDPTDINIGASSDAGGGFDGGSPTDIYEGTAATATLRADTLNTALQASNVLVTTQSAFLNGGTIEVVGNTNLFLAGGSRTLTLQADEDILINDPLTIIDASGQDSVLAMRAGGSISINSALTCQNLARIDLEAVDTIDLDNSLVAQGASVFCTSNAFTSTGGGTNALSADQCTIVASDTITFSNDTNFTGSGATSALVLQGGGNFTQSQPLRLMNWGTATLEGGSDYLLDAGINLMEVDQLTIRAANDLRNQGGTNLIQDLTNQKSALIMTAGRDIVINSQIDLNHLASASLEATRDFLLNQDFEPEGTQKVAVFAGNNIEITNAAADVIALSIPELTFTAQNMLNCGEPFIFTDVGSCKLIAKTGDLNFGAGSILRVNGTLQEFALIAEEGDLNIGPSISVNANGGIGKTQLSALQGDVFFNHGVFNVNGSGSIDVYAGNDVRLGTTTGSGVSQLALRNGQITVKAERDLYLRGGLSSNSRAQIGFSAGQTVDCDIFLSIGRDIQVLAGGNSNSIALIGHGFVNVNGNYSGDIIVQSVGRDVILEGSTNTAGSLKFAQIGHARTSGTNTLSFSGDIRGEEPDSFASIGGHLQIRGGSDTESYALFGHGGQDSNANETYTGAIRVEADTISLVGGAGADAQAALGFFAVAQVSGSNPVSFGPGALVDVRAAGDITMQANTNGIVAVGARILNTASHLASINCERISLTSGGNLRMQSGTGAETEAFLGAFVTEGASLGSVDLDIGGNLLMTAGTGAPVQIVNGSGLAFGDASMSIQVGEGWTAEALGSQAAKVTCFTGNCQVDVLGTTTLKRGAFLEHLGGGESSIFLTSNEAFFQEGSFVQNGGNGTLEVQTTENNITLLGGSFLLSQGEMQVVSSADLILNDRSFCESSASSLSITSRGSCILSGSSGGATFLRSALGGYCTAQESIFLLGASSIGAAQIETLGGDLTLVAGKNIDIQPFGVVANQGSGDLVLVVDQDFPSPPEFGQGRLLLSSLGSIESSGGDIRLFTGDRSLNVIEGVNNLGGNTYTPGPLFADTDLERWGVYFPSTFGGSPFTFFYKNESEKPPPPAPSTADLLAEDPQLFTPTFGIFYALNESKADVRIEETKFSILVEGPAERTAYWKQILEKEEEMIPNRDAILFDL